MRQELPQGPRVPQAVDSALSDRELFTKMPWVECPQLEEASASRTPSMHARLHGAALSLIWPVAAKTSAGSAPSRDRWRMFEKKKVAGIWREFDGKGAGIDGNFWECFGMRVFMDPAKLFEFKTSLGLCSHGGEPWEDLPRPYS